MRSVAPGAVRAVFERCVTLPAVVACALEGRLGEVVASDGAARLILGCYEVYAGDPGSSGARRLVADAVPGRELVYGNDPAWRALLEDVHRERLAPRPMEVFDGADLVRRDLVAIAERAPPDVTVRPLDAALAAQLDDGLAPHGLQTFASPHDLVTRGLAYGAVADGQVVSAATSYSLSERTVEVAIATRASHRGRGLAAATAAAFLAAALDAGRVPHWSAANPVSRRLARRLGLTPRGTCEAFVLATPRL